MKVKYVNKNNIETTLTRDNTYIVVAIEFNAKYVDTAKYIQFRIIDDEKNVILCYAEDFEIILGEISVDWIFLNRKENDYSILPKKIAYNSFWEDYYNGNNEAKELLNEIYIDMISKCFCEDEIKGMLNSKNANVVIYAIKALAYITTHSYDDIILSIVEDEIKSLKNYSNMQIRQILIEGYKYLSTRTGNNIENLFQNYYEHDELYCDELDEIVGNYFLKER